MRHLVAAVVAASALAAPQTHAAPLCPKVTVVLHGVVDASPGSDFSLPYGLLVDVTSANPAGRAYIRATQPVSVVVGSRTAVSRQGQHTLAALQWGDRVTVTARTCRTGLAHRATPSLDASRVLVTS